MMWPNQMTYRVRGSKINFPFSFHYGSTEAHGISSMTNSYWLIFCRLSHVVGINAIIIYMYLCLRRAVLLHLTQVLLTL